MLAGRKLLLADDSITIQKVVDLTFTDEGVTVLCVNNGVEAAERLADFRPDVVLADVFMPQMNGYELCEFIRKNDDLKHIPVLLLVGSFEPFSEEEARRVGANDTLTKPFQSIRRLIEKVGLLTSARPPEELIPTAELPQPEHEAPAEKLSTAELEMTTADTQPLPDELRHVVDDARAQAAQAERSSERYEAASSPAPVPAYEGAGELLLDLGDTRQQAMSSFDDDFVLDIDLDDVPEPEPVAAFASPVVAANGDYQVQTADLSDVSAATIAPPALEPMSDQLANTWEFERVVDEPVEEQPHVTAEVAPPMIEAPATVVEEPVVEEPIVEGPVVEGPVVEGPVVEGPVVEEAEPSPASVAAPTSASELSPEMIDAVAKRAVELLSEKVVQEIAWEVVPQLAELMIKRQLEEKNS